MKHKTSILLVEDSITARQTLKLAIETQLNLDVVTAITFKEAREILEERKDDFFLAILDLNLPDAPDGEIVDLVIKSGVPPIILTVTGSEMTHEFMTQKPIIDYIVKKGLNEIQYIVDSIKRLLTNRSRKALIVDDSPASRALIRSLLERQYLTVIEAPDGIVALQELENDREICLVITDYSMPHMDGEEFVIKAREKYSRHELAIIGMSVLDETRVSVKLLKSGANDFLTKPFSHEEFLCRINQNLDAIASFKSLAMAATSDFLTGLHNRKYMLEFADKLLENAKRKNITITVAMIDIDHFKKINDAYGHNVGDMALQHLARIVAKQVRSSDLLARLGGEEFCVICTNLNPENAQAFMERIRQHIQQNPLIHNQAQIPISVSIGYTCQLKGTFEEMLADADSALYRAKNNGRGMAIRFQPGIK